MHTKPPENRISLEDLTHRLHHVISSHQGVPSPDHLRSLLVQALGAPDWEGANEAWDEMECAPENEQQSTAVVNALWEYQQGVALLQKALECARTEAREPQHIVDAAKNLRRVIAPLELEGNTGWLLSRIHDETNKAIANKAALNDAALDKLDRLFERAREALDPIFFPAASHHKRPLPENFLENSATLIGDWRLIAQALDLFESSPHRPGQDCENNEALQFLCRWWNENAPEGSRHAGCFYIHELDEDGNELSVLGYEECPPSNIEDFGNAGDFVLFEIPGRQPLAITFLRGRKFNRYVGHSTQVYTTSGEVYWDIGTALENVDEARYSISGLKRLSQEGALFRELLARHHAETLDKQTPSVNNVEAPARL